MHMDRPSLVRRRARSPEQTTRPAAARRGAAVARSYTFALKKTSKSIVCSFEQLYGAAVMNNTYCVGIFMVLIYAQGLYWSFTAETIAILFVEIIMVYFAYKRTHRMIDGFLVVGLYPLALGLVAFLMYGCGLE